MATFVRTSLGRWKAVVRKTGWPITSKTFRIKRDAEDWARQTEDEMVRGIFVERVRASEWTVKTALERYLREVSPTKKASTARRERQVADVLISALGKYGLAALSPDLIAKYRDKRLAKGMSRDTVRVELALLSHLFTVAIREWRLGLLYNPVANVRKPSPGAGRNRRLTADEQSRLLEACDQHSNPMLGWVVRIALYTGMRAGEIQSLQRSQVDLDRRVVRLEQTKNGSARTVPLSNAAAAVLRDAMNHPRRPKDTRLIFWGEPGRDRKRKPYVFHPAWYDAIRRAKLEDLRFHDLRHEAVSRLVEAGLSDQEVAAVSGHKSMQMVRRYTHLRAEDLVGKLDAVVA